MITDRLPYPGLRAFTREESDLFFGREGSVDTMVDCLAVDRFMAVLGPSGSGKSSLVRTGLLDALELGLLSQAGSHWKIADMHPGGEPMCKLAAALMSVRAGAPADKTDIELMAAFLRRGPRSVVEWAKAGNVPDGFNLLILVDQFEELFRYADYAQREEAEAFVATLLESSSDPRVPIYVVITMRSEYLGACASIQGLAERISAGLYLAPRMDRDQCREAIEGPAGVLGFKVESALVNRLLNDLASFAPWQENESGDLAALLARQADQLPLMQHVLNRLWLRAKETAPGEAIELKLADYDRIGGLSGALDSHGEEVINRLGAERLGTIEEVFRALISGNSLATAVRRPCRMKELIAVVGGRRDDAVAIVEAFREAGCNFLRTSDDSLGDEVIVDISHESLIRQWTPLRQWLEIEARDGAEWRRLLAAEERYTQHEGGLLTGLDYQSSAAWWEKASPSAIWASRHGGNFESVQTFLAASREAESAQAEAERLRQIRERNRLRMGIAALAMILAAVSGLGLWGWREARNARTANDKLSSTLETLRTTNQNLADAKAESDAQSKQLQIDKDAQSALLVKLNIKIGELDAAKKQSDQANEDLKEALTRATTAEQNDEKDAQRLTKALDDISGIVNSDQYGGLLGAEGLEADLMDEIQKNEADIEAQHRNMVDADLIVRDDRRSAGAFGAKGNVLQELKLLEKGYNDGLKVIQFPPAAKQPPSEQLLSDFLRDAYSYDWLLFDVGETQQGEQVFNTIEGVDKSIAQYLPHPQTRSLVRALSFVENLEARYYSDKMAGISGEQRKKLDDLAEAHIRKALELAIQAGSLPDPDVHNTGVGATILETRAYLNVVLRTSNPDRESLLAKACKLIDDLYSAHSSDASAIGQRMECLFDEAYYARQSDGIPGAMTKYLAAEAVGKSALQYDPGNQYLLLWMARLENAIADITDQGSTAAGHLETAKDYFVQALKGKTANLSSTGLLANIYWNCSRIIFGRPESELQFYKDIVESLSQTSTDFPKNKDAASIVADASMHVGRLLAAQPDQATEAEKYLSRSIDLYDKSGLMQDLSFDDDKLADFCSLYVTRARLYGATGRPDLMLADTAKMKNVCSPALEKFPWDSHLREQFIKSAANAGRALFDLHRYKDALPYLEYASHWTDRDSSNLLARLYREGLTGPPDETRAKELDALAAKQSVASFTYPVVSGGITYSQDVVVREWPSDYPFKGIEDLVQWLKATGRAPLDPAVPEQFLKIFNTAQEQNLSFPDLCTATLNKREPDAGETKVDTKTLNERAALALAQNLAEHKKRDEAIKATDRFVSIDPDSLAVLGAAADLYHEVLFQFDRAFEVDRKRVELGGGAGADSDFAEASFTATRYDSCASLSDAIRNTSSQKRMTIIMTSLEFACLTGANRHDAALAAGRQLRSELSGLTQVGWNFSGTKHFVSSHRPFEPEGGTWVSLFEALEEGDEKKAQAALTALGVPEEQTATGK